MANRPERIPLPSEASGFPPCRLRLLAARTDGGGRPLPETPRPHPSRAAARPSALEGPSRARGAFATGGSSGMTWSRHSRRMDPISLFYERALPR